MSAPSPFAPPDPWPRPGLAELRPGLAELVLDIAATSVAEREADALLREVCARLTALCALTGCAAVLYDRSTSAVRTVVASHPEAEQLTRLVQQLGLGVSAAAIQAGRENAVEDLTESVRAGLADAAQRVGLPVTAGVALRGGDGLVGCLQLFSRARDALGPGLLAELAPLATVLGAVMGNLEAYLHSASLVASLTAALDRQGPIEQAKGMLAERHGVDLDTAYRMLREQARRRSAAVLAVATELVGHSWRASSPTLEADPSPAATGHASPDPISGPAREAEPGRAPANTTGSSPRGTGTEPEGAARPGEDPSEEPPGQAALLDVSPVPGRPATPARSPARRSPSSGTSPLTEQTSLLDLAGQAPKPDRNGADPPADQTSLPEQRDGSARVERRPTG